MKVVTTLILTLATSVVLHAPVSVAWDNFRAHPEVTDSGQARSQLDRFLREELALPSGIVTPLALQRGFDTAIDADVATVRAGSSSGSFAGGPLLPVSDPFRSRFDESLNRAFDFFAPADDALEINERCPPPDDPEAQDCIAALGRNAVEELLRIGVFGEDNPNKRARHHFHDPVRTHGPAAGGSSPPNGNRGLDNLTIAGRIGRTVRPGKAGRRGREDAMTP